MSTRDCTAIDVRGGPASAADGTLDNHDSPSGALAAGVGKKKFTIPLHATIAAAAALSIIVVASMALGITVASSRDAVDAVGRKYAGALVADSRRSTQGFADQIVTVARTIARMHEQEGIGFPSEHVGTTTSSDRFAQLRLTAQYVLMTRLFAPAIGRINLLYDDGSFLDALPPDVVTNVTAMTLSNGAWLTYDGPAGGYDARDYQANADFNLTNLAAVHDSSRVVLPTTNLTDSRLALYRSIRPALASGKRGLWMPMLAFGDVQAGGDMTVGLPVVIPIFNATAFLGISVVTTDLSSTNALLRALDRTPNTQAFLLDGIPSILAGTIDAPLVHSYTTTDAGAVLPGSCSSSSAIADISAASGVTHNITVSCRALPSEVPYAPLRDIASGHPDWLEPAAGETDVGTFTSDGKTHYAARGGLSSTERAFAMSLLLVMPEADILGGIIAARNGAIGAVAAGTVLLAALCAVLIAAFLRPLKDVAQRMRRTARLDEAAMVAATGGSSADHPVADSVFSEVYDLQHAYAQMGTALASFTRYVPRDVVKELMASGELCAIAMVPKQCTMLFVDIAGFTSMCERVAPDELSELVRLYFERMSSLVMQHSGLIDKYVGDCIMAVWGAPFTVANAEVKATLCALRLAREARVAPLAERFDAAGERLRVRVGVASGAVLAGNMGSDARMNYTVIGDAVNLASRLESLNKQFGTEVLLCERTARIAEGVVAMRLLMAIRVVGKDVPVRVYHPFGVIDTGGTTASPPSKSDLCSTHANAAAAFRPPSQGIAELQEIESGMAASARLSFYTGSVASGSGIARQSSRQLRTAVAVLSEAGALSGPTLRALPPSQERAAQFTEAVERYMLRDFQGALARLTALHLTAHSPSASPIALKGRDGGGAFVNVATDDDHGYDTMPTSEYDALERSLTAARVSAAAVTPSVRLMELCEKYLRSPPGPEFDGTWTITSK